MTTGVAYAKMWRKRVHIYSRMCFLENALSLLICTSFIVVLNQEDPSNQSR